MELKVTKIEGLQLEIDPQGIVILPQNHNTNEIHEYHSTTISFYKYSKDKLSIEYLSEPELLVEQRSGDWFGPILLITSTAIAHNPELISITCGVIANYITDFFRGNKDTKIRLKIIHKETKTSRLTEISYEGGIEGLSQLESSIEKIASKGLSDE